MKTPLLIVVPALVSALFFSGCGETVEAIVEPVPDISATQVGKYKFEYFHKAPEDRPFVVVAVVTAKTSNLDKAKDTFRKHSKPFKAQAAVNLRAVKVGNYRGLSVHNWQADLVIWQ